MNFCDVTIFFVQNVWRSCFEHSFISPNYTDSIMPPKKKAAPRKTKAQAAAEAKAEAEAQATAAAAVEAEAKANEGTTKEDEEETVTVKTTTMTTETVVTTTLTIVSAQEESKEGSNNIEEAKEEEEKEVVKEKPEKKSGRSKRKAKDEEVAEKVEKATASTTTSEEPQAPVPTSGPNQDQEMKEVESEASSSSASAPAPKTNGAALTMAERMEKLKGLRQKMNASKQENRKDLMAEHQKSKVNHREEAKKARAREAAEEMMAKQEAEEAGEDYERSQFWNYSAESVERWNEKQEAKRIRMDNKFTDWDQMNHKKYLRQVGELKPNLAAYNAKKEAAMHVNEDGELVVASDSGFYRDANSVAFLSDAKPNALAVDRLAADVAKQIEARSKFSKRRAHKDDEDVNYINDANQRFNQKIARFYDKHTKEIRDDFERGTAL
ncbi:MAG: SYF2 splicing factor-domain-containing protein [Linnemannia elongata]|nr:MAG: SYF2 splicing factor-domain-containing protein [Linnemannia elongata]